MIEYAFVENYNLDGRIIFDKNGIAVTTNDTTYNIYEPQLSTIVNACEYSYDEDNSTYILNLFPNAETSIDDYPRKIIFSNSNNYFKIDDEGLSIHRNLINSNMDLILDGTSITLLCEDKINRKYSKVNISSDGYVEIVQSDTDYGKIINFRDNIGNRDVSFTFDELIALKALLPTT